MNDEILKQNLLNLINEHKKSCNDPECNVSLNLIFELGRKAGLTFEQHELSI